MGLLGLASLDTIYTKSQNMEEKQQNSQGLRVGIIQKENGYELLHGGQYGEPSLGRLSAPWCRRSLWIVGLFLGILSMMIFLPILYTRLAAPTTLMLTGSMNKLPLQRMNWNSAAWNGFPTSLSSTRQEHRGRHEPNNQMPLDPNNPSLPQRLVFDPITLEADLYSMLDIQVRLRPCLDSQATTMKIDMTVIGMTTRQLERVLVEKALVFDLLKGTMELHMSLDGPHRNLLTDGPVEVRMDIQVPIKKLVQGLRFYAESMDILIESSQILNFGELNIGTGNGKVVALDESLLLARDLTVLTTNGNVELFGLSYQNSVNIETEKGNIQVPALFPHRMQGGDLGTWMVRIQAREGDVKLTTAELDNVEFLLNAKNGQARLLMSEVDKKDRLSLKDDRAELKSGVYSARNQGMALEGYMDIQTLDGNVEWKVSEKVKVVQTPMLL